MKKLALAIVCVTALAGSALAQGVLGWGNFAGAFVGQTNSTTYSPLFGGGTTGGGAAGNTTATGPAGFYYELLYNTTFGVSGPASVPGSLSSLFAWSDTGLQATNNGGASNGRIVPIASNLQAPVAWAQGTTNNILLVGWSANIGALGTGQETWLNVSNVLSQWTSGADYEGQVSGNPFFGTSVVGYLNPATPPANGPAVFGAGATSSGLPIVNGASSPEQLYLLPTSVIPEPTTFALASLGGLAMVMFRRRK